MDYTLKAAKISEDGLYRYWLTREWSLGDGDCVFIGLNPSTADADDDDPTIRRCVDFAQRWGCRRLFMINLFAYRATKPADMKAAANPINGIEQENDYFIFQVCVEAKYVVAAWGNGGTHLGRDKEVLQLLADNGIEAHCLKLTNLNNPWHPLYVKADTPLQELQKCNQ